MPFLVEIFTIFYPNIAAREEKRRQLYKKLLDDGSDDAEKALDYLSEVGDATERTVAKFDMARISVRRRATEQAANCVLEAAPLAGDGVSRAISRAQVRVHHPRQTTFPKSKRWIQRGRCIEAAGLGSLRTG